MSHGLRETLWYHHARRTMRPATRGFPRPTLRRVRTVPSNAGIPRSRLDSLISARHYGRTIGAVHAPRFRLALRVELSADSARVWPALRTVARAGFPRAPRHRENSLATETSYERFDMGVVIAPVSPESSHRRSLQSGESVRCLGRDRTGVEPALVAYHDPRVFTRPSRREPPYG